MSQHASSIQSAGTVAPPTARPRPDTHPVGRWTVCARRMAVTSDGTCTAPASPPGQLQPIRAQLMRPSGNQARGQPEHTPSAASVPVWATLQPRVMHASSRWARGGRARAPRNIAVAGASLPLGLHTNLPGSGQALALLPGTGSGAPGTELEPSRGAGEISPICPSGSRGDPGQPPA